MENEQNKTNEQPTQQNEQKRVSSSNVLMAKPVAIVTGAEFNPNTIDELFKEIPNNARFSGSANSMSALPADISEAFDIRVADHVTLSSRVVEVTTINEGQKPFVSNVATMKIPVEATVNGQTYSSNLLITRENENEVKALLRNKTAKATTSHWEGLSRKDGSNIAKLELVTVAVPTMAVTPE